MSDSSISERIDTGTEEVLVGRKTGVLTITLNRPKARNALTLEMLAALEMALAYAETDARVRCVVLTGAAGTFCSGGDIRQMLEGGSDASAGLEVDERIAAQRRSQRGTIGRLYNLPKPTLAMLTGAVAGAGLSLALACDLRIMAKNAYLVTAFARVGVSGDYGGTFLMSRLVGTAKTRELYFLSDRVSADEALSLGLTNWVCDPDKSAGQAQSVAERLAAGPGIAYRYMKENLNRAICAVQLSDCMDLEATHHVHCTLTADHREAAQAFVDKRQPSFARPDSVVPEPSEETSRREN